MKQNLMSEDDANSKPSKKMKLYVLNTCEQGDTDGYIMHDIFHNVFSSEKNPSNCEVCLYRRNLKDCANLLGANCMTDAVRNLIKKVETHLPACSNIVLQFC